jgi:hypothetical protein
MDGDRLYDLASFVVERRSDGGAFETIATIPVTDTDRLRTQKGVSFHRRRARCGHARVSCPRRCR